MGEEKFSIRIEKYNVLLSEIHIAISNKRKEEGRIESDRTSVHRGVCQSRQTLESIMYIGKLFEVVYRACF